MQRLVLFDIDGTLLSSRSGIGRQAFARVLTERFGQAVRLAPEQTAGQTDPHIAETILRSLGVPEEQLAAMTAAIIAAYLEILAQEYTEANGAFIYPGVRELLQRLHDHPAIVLGLLTGNVAPGARIKLGAFGLDRFFCLGAYGSDHQVRSQLPAIAVQRAQDLTGRQFQGKEIVIIGDTVHDVTCGQHLGVRTIAVLTHPPFRDAIQAAGPDHLLENFLDAELVLRAILA